MVRVGIVGGGVGAVVASFYLSKKLKSDCLSKIEHISIVTDNIGGRVQHCSIDDENTVEVGGSIFQTNGSNPNICQLIEEASATIEGGVELYNMYGDVDSSGVWDGKKFVFKTLKLPKFLHSILPFDFFKLIFILIPLTLYICIYINRAIIISKIREFINMIYLLYMFGVSTIWSLMKFSKKNVHIFSSLFTQYKSKDYIDTFINKINAPVEFLSKNGKDYLLENYNINPKFLELIFEPAIRSIYSQGMEDYHTAAVLINAMAADSSYLRTFKHGNSYFFERLLKLCGDKVTVTRNKKVNQVTRLQNNNKFEVKCSDGTVQNFDIVVLAAPLEKCDIEFINLDEVAKYQKESKVEYIKTYLTVVVGEVNPKYFNCNSIEEVPQVIRTTQSSEKNDCDFTSFQTIWKSKSGQPITKILSKMEISEIVLNKMFLNRSRVERYTFDYAYPKLRTLSKECLQAPCTFCDNKFFYLNSIEKIGSAIEALTYSARNVSTLIESSLQADC